MGISQKYGDCRRFVDGRAFSYFCFNCQVSKTLGKEFIAKWDTVNQANTQTKTYYNIHTDLKHNYVYIKVNSAYCLHVLNDCAHLVAADRENQHLSEWEGLSGRVKWGQCVCVWTGERRRKEAKGGRERRKEGENEYLHLYTYKTWSFAMGHDLIC